MSSFKDLRIVDNFYQTSAFFPMPTLLISTLEEDGDTTKFGCHFILRIDKILMKEKYHDAIINGVKAGSFPRVFLKAALTQMVDYAREQGWTLIDVPQMQEIRDKRAKEKK